MLGFMRRVRGAVIVGAALWSTTVLAGEVVIPLEGEVPDDGLDHFFVPFDVPKGTVEIEVRHDDDSNTNILDWGLYDGDGFRGWGGGNSEPAIVGEEAASRSYVPGAIEAGQWQVVVGKAQIMDPPGNYTIEILMRETATLKPQTRTPYVDAEALVEGTAWYAGDFHVHSVESGDARPPLDEIGTFARDRGLDFVVITDHNVHTAQDFFGQVQGNHPELLFIPGVEFTTYAGHGNAIGASAWVDHKIGQPDVTIEGAIAAYHDQGALFSINHPTLDLGPLCIGCAWGHDVDGSTIDAVEIASGGLEPFGWMFVDDAIDFWDSLCAEGFHVAAIGGSDDHKAGVDLNQFQSPIGDPTTLVLAERLDVPSIMEGVRSGRTVVKLQGPDDPTLTFDAVEEIVQDTISANEVTFVAQIEGGEGQEVRLVHNGEAGDLQVIDADPFEAQWTVQAPDEGEDRYRVEVFVDGERRVVTSHLWVQPGPPGGADSTGGDDDTSSTTTASMPGTTSVGTSDSDSTGTAGQDDNDSGCSCRAATHPRGWVAGGLWALLLLSCARRRR